MASKETIVKAVNTIRANSSPMYQERIPVATDENLSNVANPILSSQECMNEFLTSLINRIGLTIIHNKSLKDPLALLKKGNDYPLGVTIQEIFTNPAVAEKYNRKSTDLLAQKEPDVKVAYHHLNRQDRYTVTVSKPELRQAFNSYESLDKMLTNLTQSLYSGNYTDEFLLCKKLLSSAVVNNHIIKETVPKITSKETAEEFLAKSKTIFQNFSFPSSKYNSWKLENPDPDVSPVITWTPPEDVIFIVNSETSAYCDVKALASAYNMDEAQFKAQRVLVDDFLDATNCVAILCDKSFTQIYDKMKDQTSFFNGGNLVWNYYYHIWQTYSVSPFANAVAFVTE